MSENILIRVQKKKNLEEKSCLRVRIIIDAPSHFVKILPLFILTHNDTLKMKNKFVNT